MINKEYLSKIKNVCVNRYFDIRATYYLRKNVNKKHPISKAMKIGFVVFEPETWDKQQPIFLEFRRRGMDAGLIIVPSYDRELKLTKIYGKELDYFKKIDDNAVLAVENGEWVDISQMGYDYIFYQDPYAVHMPKTLRCDNVVKFAKICYIPYGFSGSNVFDDGNTNEEFFRNVYYEFVDTDDVADILNKRYSKNASAGLQHFVNLGYPSFLSYNFESSSTDVKTITWTPRWSYDPKIGGSHFLEYKDLFLDLVKRYSNLSFVFRPHPMMFKNLIDEGRISRKSVKEYTDKLNELGVIFSQGNDLKTDLDRTDILITDYSSIIPMFFVSGKPIVYCNSQIVFNKEMKDIAKGMYMTESWDDVAGFIDQLLSGTDKLFEVRQKIGAEIIAKHFESDKRIVDTLIRDFEEKKR